MDNTQLLSMSIQSFDSDIFGINYFRTKTKDINKDNILRDLIKIQEPYVIDTKIDSSDMESNLLLKQLGFEEICTQVELEMTDIKHEVQDCDITITETLELEDSIIKKHGENFTYNRFALNSIIAKDTSSQLYAKWAKNSLQNINIKVAYIDNDFCTFKIKDGAIVLDLLSVLDKGKNKGTKIIKALKNYALKNNIQKIQATTETGNKMAFNLYQKNNFKVVNFISCFNLTRK